MICVFFFRMKLVKTTTVSDVCLFFIKCCKMVWKFYKIRIFMGIAFQMSQILRNVCPHWGQYNGKRAFLFLSKSLLGPVSSNILKPTPTPIPFEAWLPSIFHLPIEYLQDFLLILMCHVPIWIFRALNFSSNRSSWTLHQRTSISLAVTAF